MTEATPLTKVNVRLSGPVLEALNSVANKLGQRLDDVVCEAVVRYIEDTADFEAVQEILSDRDEAIEWEDAESQLNAPHQAEGQENTGSTA